MSQRANTTQVLFDKPICIEIKAPLPQGRQHTYDYQEIGKFLDGCRNAGFDDRAVVCLNSGMRHTIVNGGNWGIVTDLCRTGTYNNEPYRPIKVLWARDGKTTTHWPEDLILIHRPITMWEVDLLLEESKV